MKKLKQKLRRSLGKYSYWNFLITGEKAGINSPVTTNCQAACSPGDPCSADPTCSMSG